MQHKTNSCTFQSVKSMEKLTDSSKLYNFIEDFSDYGNQFSLICGKIKALFGQPIYETENLENLYVRQAEAIDYAYKAYNLDGPTALEFGIRDGAPYYNETELRLSEKELRELFFNM